MPRNAPVGLTTAQIVAIYKGDVTNWNQVGGSCRRDRAEDPAGRVRHPQLLRRASSGRTERRRRRRPAPARSSRCRSTTTPTIKNNPNAIAPFSAGRAGLLGSTLRFETGFKADRAVYNVVRGADVGNANDPGGVRQRTATSARRRPSRCIEQAGFKQLFPPSKGGVCGQPTQSATSNFTVADVPTTTTVAGDQRQCLLGARSWRRSRDRPPRAAPWRSSRAPPCSSRASRWCRARPRASSRPTPGCAHLPGRLHPGRQHGVPDVGGHRDRHRRRRRTSTITETFPKKVEKGKKAKGTVTVTLTGATAKASGQITVKEGKKILATKTLANGRVTFKLPKLAVGKHTLVISWPGDANGNAGTLTFKLKVTGEGELEQHSLPAGSGRRPTSAPSGARTPSTGTRHHERRS